MKLKDILNKKKAINEARLKPSGFKDYSTSNLKSNIDQKWKDERNIEEDLVAWFDGAISAGGTDLGGDIIMAIKKALSRMSKFNNAYKE